jgi:hypothetical protein
MIKKYCLYYDYKLSEINEDIRIGLLQYQTVDICLTQGNVTVLFIVTKKDTDVMLEPCPRNNPQVVDKIRADNTHTTHVNTIEPILFLCNKLDFVF